MLFLGLPGLPDDPGRAAKTCCKEISEELTHSNGKRKQALADVEAHVLDRVALYVEHKGNPERFEESKLERSVRKKKAQTYSEADKEADEPEWTVGDLLFGRYRSGGGTDSTIVGHVARPTPTYCPYCGLYMIGKPDSKSPDRDHVLPRSRYPEFSILRVNLVPVCDDCNDTKDDKVFDANGNWLFIHPYFDDFLAGPVLSATFQAGFLPKLTFAVTDALPDGPDRNRLGRHISELDIPRRLGESVGPEALRALRTHQLYWVENGDTEGVRQKLRKVGEEELSQRPNDPTGLGLVALAECEELEELLRSKLTPA